MFYPILLILMGLVMSLFQIGKKASLGKVLYLDGVARWVEDVC